MAEKEGKIFIEVVCSNCGAVMKNGWAFRPKEGEETVWKVACPACRMPVEVTFRIN